MTDWVVIPSLAEERPERTPGGSFDIGEVVFEIPENGVWGLLTGDVPEDLCVKLRCFCYRGNYPVKEDIGTIIDGGLEYMFDLLPLRTDSAPGGESLYKCTSLPDSYRGSPTYYCFRLEWRGGDLTSDVFHISRSKMIRKDFQFAQDGNLSGTVLLPPFHVQSPYADPVIHHFANEGDLFPVGRPAQR